MTDLNALLGRQSIAFEFDSDLQALAANEEHLPILIHKAFNYGVIVGKRQERARHRAKEGVSCQC